MRRAKVASSVRAPAIRNCLMIRHVGDVDRAARFNGRQQRFGIGGKGSPSRQKAYDGT